MRIERLLPCESAQIWEIAGRPLEYHPHIDDTPQFSIALEGVLHDVGGSYVFEREPGSITYRPAGTRHSVFSDTGGRGLCIEVEPAHFGRICASAGFDPAAAAHLPGAGLGGLADQFYFEARRAGHEQPLMLEALTLMLIARFAAVLRRRSRGGRPSWLDDALELLRERSRDGVRPEAVAAELGVPLSDLHAAVTTSERTTVAALLERHRVEWAAEQLRVSRRPVGWIAQEAGFYDNSHLVRAFRRVVGTTPTAYRRAHRIEDEE